jgi:hypothetical protein
MKRVKITLGLIVAALLVCLIYNWQGFQAGYKNDPTSSEMKK